MGGRTSVNTSCLSLYHHNLTQNPQPSAPDTATRADTWVSIQQNPESRTSPERISPERPLFWCSESRHSLGDEEQAASFPSWGRARRHVRVRKELSLGGGNSTGNSPVAQLQRARNLLKPETLPVAFAFPDSPHVRLRQSQHNASSGSSHSPGKLAPSFLPVHSPHLTLGSEPTSSTKPLGRLSL